MFDKTIKVVSHENLDDEGVYVNWPYAAPETLYNNTLDIEVTTVTRYGNGHGRELTYAMIYGNKYIIGYVSWKNGIAKEYKYETNISPNCTDERMFGGKVTTELRKVILYHQSTETVIACSLEECALSGFNGEYYRICENTISDTNPHNFYETSTLLVNRKENIKIVTPYHRDQDFAVFEKTVYNMKMEEIKTEVYDKTGYEYNKILEISNDVNDTVYCKLAYDNYIPSNKSKIFLEMLAYL